MMSLFVFATFGGVQGTAQVNDVMFPGALAAWETPVCVGASVTFIPRPIAEEEIRQIPLVEARARMGLPLGFSANGRLATNVLTTLATLGLQWSTATTVAVVGAGVEETFVVGFATMDGFDVDYRGWLTSPFVALGWSIGDINLGMRVETGIITERTTRVGEVVSANEKNVRSGNALSVSLEQPLTKRNSVVLGLKVNNLKSAYQSWLAFSTFNDPLLYPEFFVGVKL
ncbi:MAG: hypothetical protein ACKOAX_07060 [Candidatus Kapaibacterium sp.]